MSITSYFSTLTCNQIALYLGIISLLILLKRYFSGPSTKHTHRLDDKIIIVTGSTDGIGKVTALDLLNQGAKVIFAVRNKDKAQNIINQINDPKQRENAIIMNLDLSRFKSIRSFVDEFKKRFDRLDILVNNAGTLRKDFVLTEDGIEETVQANTISPIILSYELLDLLEKSNGRIINVASRAQEFATYDFNLMKEIEKFNHQSFSGLSAFSRYSLSKIGNVFFSQYLADYNQRNNINVPVVSLHPGTIATELNRDYGILRVLFFLLKPLFWLTFKSVIKGAQTTLDLCYIDPKLIQTGAYYADCSVQKVSSAASSKVNRDLFMNWVNHVIQTQGKQFNFEIKKL